VEFRRDIEGDKDLRVVMKIGFFGKQNAFALETLRRLQLDHSRDDFSPWQPGEEAPSTELEVIIACDGVASTEIEAQAKLGLIQMASAGYEGVDVDAATECFKSNIYVDSMGPSAIGLKAMIEMCGVDPRTVRN
jgi:hypothetical protein